MTAVRASTEVSKASMAGPHSALESHKCLPDNDPAFFLIGLVPPHRAACSETVLQNRSLLAQEGQSGSPWAALGWGDMPVECL